jgi:hypothetical protein
LVTFGLSACSERPASPDAIDAGQSETPVTAPVAVAQPQPPAQPPPDGCIRGGTPRAQVQALLGEPDSISFGTWLYGRSSIDFGYGVVVAYSDADQNLMVC